jgi:hypothetical protein
LCAPYPSLRLLYGTFSGGSIIHERLGMRWLTFILAFIIFYSSAEDAVYKALGVE